MSGVVTRGAGDRLLVLAGQALHGVHSTLSWPRDGGCSVGGWLAVGGRGGWEPWLLGLAIGTWVAGFDILYACQDLDVDRLHGLHSIPVRFGVATSLRMSRALHVVTVVALAALAVVLPLGLLYLAGLGGVASLLAYEQSLVRADDLSRVKEAFDLNGYVGIFYLVVTALALYVN